MEVNLHTDDFYAGKCIQSLVEAQVERTRDAVAIVFKDQQLTYRELNCRANQLAHHLQEQGVGPDVLVAVCLERSLDMIVALLAILKAGGAYVPLDPIYPQARLSFMLEDSRATVLITQTTQTERFECFRGARILMDSDWTTIAQSSHDNPRNEVGPGNLAYVIYTSGSTGQPKGVMIQHGSVVNFLSSMKCEPGFGREDKLLAVSSFSFDMAGLDIYLPLIVGAQVILASAESCVTPRRLAEELSSNCATVMQATPATWRMLLDDGWQGKRSLKVLCGGEALSQQLAKKLLSCCGSVWNLYGPTETTIYSSGKNLPVQIESVDLGTPIANTQIYILDQNLKPVPIGVSGEVYIGGDGLARGYLYRSELTAEKFIPDPIVSEAGARMYGTGDLARYSPDGNIEYLGRIDNQVKIRGFRIELGEIEAVLGQHPGVWQAVVAALEYNPEDRRLVAYLVSSGNQMPSNWQLREFLRDRLPEYMLPSAFVYLDAFPLTPNGKLDRGALPQPDKIQHHVTTTSVKPASPEEEMIARIWADVFKLEEVGIHETFFELGGFSLLATQIIARIRSVLHIELPISIFFQNLTVAKLAEIIEAQTLSKVNIDFNEIKRTTHDGPRPLSFSQKRVWFLHQVNPHRLDYNFQATICFTGELDIPSLEWSLNEIVCRHEIYRTTFPDINGDPVQIIHPAQQFNLNCFSLEHLSGDERKHEVDKILQKEFQESFILTQLPLVRWLLLRLSAKEHLFVHVEHHLVHDGWSFNVFVRELLEFYKAHSSRDLSSMPELPIQFADFASWQLAWMQSDEAKRQLIYWKKKLEGGSFVPFLPCDRPRPPVQTFHGAAPRFEIDSELCAELTALSRREGVTLFMTMLSALVVLLSRYSGREDICVGSGIANRRHRESEGLIGMLVNNVALRVNVAGNPTVPELLARVRETTLETYAHQDVPFDKVVEALNEKRNLSYNPIFQVMFSFHDAPMNATAPRGLELDLALVLSNKSAKFDLNLIAIPNYQQHVGQRIQQEPTHWTIIWEYNTDLFDATTIERMQSGYRRLLEGFVEFPNHGVFQLPLVGGADTQQLLEGWNATEADYPKDKCIHEVFEQQVEKTPDAVAVVFEDQRLTYRELNQRSNQLAHYLKMRGVGPNVVVVICLERSIEMIVSLLAILKAGGAYLPLDPNYPPERITFMLEDTGAKVLLTQSIFEEINSSFGGCQVLMDRSWDEIARESRDNLGLAIGSHNLAYVIYTSGSTGTPKGVAVEHKGVMRLLFGVDYAELDSNQTILQLAPISFDAATFEVWGALLHGGKCVLFPGKMPSPGELGECLKKHRVNTLWLTAGLFNAVINDEAEALTEVEQLLIGGEALSVPHVRKALEVLPETQIINGYGPTESTTFTCCHRIPRELEEGLSSIPIGKPIGNTKVYILDTVLSPTPIGVIGELYISGEGLARGYLNRPDLTAENFLPNPFSMEPAARLYRTGDLARYLPDGNIEFLGRIDNQVKVRGFRIELGEVEAVLGQHRWVRDAVVVVRDDKLGDRRLIAYVVGDEGTVLASQELRRHVRQKLPEYMVPSAFVFLDTLPLTPNGKVDRRALPVPDQSRPELEESYVAPRTPVEEMIAEIWAGVLKIEKIGIHDNFFELGGHSLLATQVVARISQILQVEIPLRTLFEGPTVAELARRIEETRSEDREFSAPSMVPISRGRQLPLSFSQQRLWFLDQYEPGSSVYNLPSTLRLRGPLNIGALEQSLSEIIRRHESLRTTFSVVEDEPVQVIVPPLSFSVPVEDLRDRPEREREEEARRLVNEESQRPFDLARGPLFRSQLLRLGEDDHMLLLTMHHIVSDGWSMGVFYRELAVLYQAFLHGRPSPLPDLPIQYADFAVWQREWLKGEELERQLSYWKEQLAGIPAVLNLPTDHPRPAVQSYRGASQSIELSKELTEGLKALSRKENVTLFMALLAAFQALLYRYTGQQDIVVGSPIANRNRAEIEGLIGFFVNTLVLRSNFSGNPTFKELLTRVRKTSLEAYDHQDLSFEKLVEELKPERSLSHSPLVQVFFNFMELRDAEAVGLLGLAAERFESQAVASKFDLTLYVNDRGELLRFALVYNTDLFDAATATRMLEYYRTLLAGVVANPDQPVSKISLLTKEERGRLAARGNVVYPINPFTEFSKEDVEQSIPRRFEQQVKENPDHVAVKTRNYEWTYSELDQAANRIAETLVKACGRDHERIGLLFNHDAPMVAGILGALKAGKTYVPLDPAYPLERLAYIIEDSQAAAILTDHRSIDVARTLTDGKIQLIDIDNAQKSGSASNPDVTILPDTLAYILYTSGSTGWPKGVMQNHRNVLHHIRNYTNSLHISSDDRLTLLSSYSFDAAVMDIFGALLNGATLFPIDLRKETPSAVIRWMMEKKITIYHSTSTIYRYLLGSRDGKANLANVRLVVMGGEEVQRKDVLLFKDNFSEHSIFVNGLGPTESTVALQYFISPKEEVRSHVVPVGYPVEDTEVLLLNDAGEDAEVYGEIAIKSAHVALGYWRQAEMTQKVFLPDSEDDTKRIYRTGDMGRLLADGSIAFIGRKDFQVKIRGMRIELGEIEAVLSHHPAVREAVVLAREDAAEESAGVEKLDSKSESLRSDKQLVAYVVPKQEPVPKFSELGSFLRQKLPDYMVPSAFVFLDTLPLTPNGKVDRRALPVPDQSRPALEESYVAPRTPVEEMIAEIWAGVLKIEKIGIHDNFFELGGHSLMATQVVSRVRGALEEEIPLRMLFEYPTVAGLAKQVIGSQPPSLGTEEMTALLTELESFSEQEADNQLANMRRQSPSSGTN